MWGGGGERGVGLWPEILLDRENLSSFLTVRPEGSARGKGVIAAEAHRWLHFRLGGQAGGVYAKPEQSLASNAMAAPCQFGLVGLKPCLASNHPFPSWLAMKPEREMGKAKEAGLELPEGCAGRGLVAPLYWTGCSTTYFLAHLLDQIFSWPVTFQARMTFSAL